MQPHRHRLAKSRTCIAVGVLGSLLIASLSACGSGGGPAEFHEAATVLTKRQVHAALLTPAELGRRFVLDRSKHGDDDNAVEEMGCLATLDDSDGPEPAAEAEANYKRTGKVGLPVAQISMASFATRDQMTATMRGFVQDIEACERVKFKDDEMTFVIDLTTDNVPSTSKVDAQVNIRGVGTVSSKKIHKAPFGVWMSMAQVGNQGVMVMVMDVNPSSGRLLNKFTAKAVASLDAVAHGNAPDEKKPVKSESTATSQPNA